MNFASWNIRGLNKSSHQEKVLNFISSNNISFMCFIGTKVKLVNSAAISRRINSRWNWVFNYEFHDNGRLWVGWDPNAWHISVHSKSA